MVLADFPEVPCAKWKLALPSQRLYYHVVMQAVFFNVKFSNWNDILLYSVWSAEPKLDAFLLKRAKSEPVHQNSTQNNSQSPSQTCSSPSKRSLLSEEIELSKVAPDDEARDVSQEDHKGSNLFLGTSNLERDLPSSSITDSSDDEKRTLGLQNCTSTHSEGDKSNLHVTLPQESGQSEVDISSHLNILHQSDEAKSAPHCRVLVTDSSTNERKELETPVADCSSVANKAVDKAPKDDEELSTICREVAEEITSCSTTNSKAGSLLMVWKHFLVRFSKTIKKLTGYILNSF